MSRPIRNGLIYFPMDVGFFGDRRIKRLISRFGADGALFYIYILCRAYDGGYYIPYDDDFVEDASLDIGCTSEKIGLMLDYLLNKSLLDRKLFDTVKVISSHGIQAQYQESMAKTGQTRDIDVDADFWILSESETKRFVKVRPHADNFGKNSVFCGEMSGFCVKNAANKIKENKKKINKNTAAATAGGAAADEEFSRVMTFFMDKLNPTPSSVLTAELQAFTKSLGADAVLHAFDIALDEQTRKWSFIKAILQRYEREGLRTLEDIRRSEQQHAESKGGVKHAANFGNAGVDNGNSGRKWNLRNDLDD